jgi:hypothetical protein
MKQENYGDSDSRNNKEEEDEDEDEDVEFPVSRSNVLSIIDNFIEQILKIRTTLFGVFLSALVLAPLAIGLSVFLLQHPSFLAVLDIENEFGIVLGILLFAVIIISSVWLLVGIKQYLSINTWNQRYREYTKEKQEVDRNIATKYGLDKNHS